jgi:hypothetical protein
MIKAIPLERNMEFKPDVNYLVNTAAGTIAGSAHQRLSVSICDHFQ